jgi:uncharacterized protein (TIGR02271 family)
VHLEDATSVLVPIEALVRQNDGSYRMILDSVVFERRHHPGGEKSGLPLVLPVIQEQLDVQTHQVETGRVRVHKIVQEREETVDPALLRDEVVVERVPINRIVEGPVTPRTEGDTMIIPLLEEVLVVEKRLLLREELHLTKRRVEVHHPQKVKLRRAEAVIEHADPDAADVT